MLLAHEGVAPHRVCQEDAAAVAVDGPGWRLLALPCTASPRLDGYTTRATNSTAMSDDTALVRSRAAQCRRLAVADIAEQGPLVVDHVCYLL